MCLIFHSFFNTIKGLKQEHCSRKYLQIRPYTTVYDLTLHPFCSCRIVRMATFDKRDSGRWRAQIRRRGHSLSDTFANRKDAEAWARRIESEIDAGKTPARKDVAGVKTLGALVDLHIEDMKEVGKPLGRTKAYSLELIKDRLGRSKLETLGRETIIQFGKVRSAEGAGPVTLSLDIGCIRTLLTDGAAIHGSPLPPEQVDRARTALKRLGLDGKARNVTGAPTQR